MMKQKYLYIIFSIIILLNLYWVIFTPILPFVDLPLHLAEAEILKYFNNPDLLFNKFYSIPSLWKANIFHTVFCSMNIFPSVEFANKIYYGFYIILLPLSSLLLIKKIGGNIFVASASVLFLINHNVHWGFTGYTLSVPVLLILFSIYFEYFINDKRFYLYIISIFWILIFFIHFQSAIFALLIFVILNIYYFRSDWEKMSLGFILMIPILALMTYSFSIDSDGSSTLNFLYNYYLHNYIYSLGDRLSIIFVLDNFFLLSGIKGTIYAVCISLIIIISFLFYIFKYKLQIKEIKFVFILLLITLFCYLTLPDNINGQNVIFERYSVLIFLILLVFISKFLNKILIYLFLFLSFTHTILILDYMQEFKNETKEFSKEFLQVPNNKVLAGAIIDNNFRDRKVMLHFAMYNTIWNNGITVGFIDYKFSPIKRKVSNEVVPYFKPWESGLNIEEYNKAVDFILIKDRNDHQFNNFKLFKKTNNWSLYQKYNFN